MISCERPHARNCNAKTPVLHICKGVKGNCGSGATHLGGEIVHLTEVRVFFWLVPRATHANGPLPGKLLLAGQHHHHHTQRHAHKKTNRNT